MRRPARLELSGALTPRDRIWSVIRQFGPGATWSVAEVSLLSEQRVDTVLPYVRGLVAAGYLLAHDRVMATAPTRELLQFHLVRDIGAIAPRVTHDGKPVTQGRGREQLWRAMRILKRFSWRELQNAASTEEHVVAPAEAKTYITFLARAGYLSQTKPARGAGADGLRAPAVYVFNPSMNTGPRAPMVTKTKTVFDANTGREIQLSQGESA